MMRVGVEPLTPSNDFRKDTCISSSESVVASKKQPPNTPKKDLLKKK
jgi:hypothetical protein